MLSSSSGGVKQAPKVKFGSVTEAYFVDLFRSQALPAGWSFLLLPSGTQRQAQIQPSIYYDEPSPLQSQKGPESQFDYFQSMHGISAAQRGLLSGGGYKTMMENGIFFNIRITQEGGCTLKASKLEYVNLADAGDFSATRKSHFSKRAL